MRYVKYAYVLGLITHVMDVGGSVAAFGLVRMPPLWYACPTVPARHSAGVVCNEMFVLT